MIRHAPHTMLTLATCATVFLVACATTTPAFADKAAEVAARFEREVKPLLGRFCVECHSGDEPKGELDLGRFTAGKDTLMEFAVWEQVMSRVSAREMPPKGSRRPNNAQVATIMRWIEAIPRDDCKQLASDTTKQSYRGYVMSRRMNRSEYLNSVRDLFGVDVLDASALPADGSGGEGFDTAGAALFTSPLHLEKYLAAANRIVQTILPDKPEGQPKHIVDARQRVLFVSPSEKLPARVAAQQIIKRYAHRAFRRPVDDKEVDRLLTMFDRSQKRGDSFVASLRLSLKSLLISPHFLFLVEPEPEKEGVHPLGHFPLATRLSYFLWSSLPDEELLRLAGEKKLHDPNVLRQQVARMLRDPKARALGENFGVQWLGIDRMGSEVRPDAKKFPEFDEHLAASMREESVLFIHSVFANNRSLIDLIDADYTFVDARLASHYGIKAVDGEQHRRVPLTDRRRGGVIAHASVLTANSYPLRTSPVLRGRWLLENLLGEKVPPPPPNVPELAEVKEDAEPKSVRERLAEHRRNPDCASCHVRMDPFGFGLENYDVLGRWRERDATGKIDATGELPNGRKFNGPVELKKLLLERKDAFTKHLTRKMLGYALGRDLNRFDRCVIDETVKALKKNDYRTQVLVEQIVLSYPFRNRYVKK